MANGINGWAKDFKFWWVVAGVVAMGAIAYFRIGLNSEAQDSHKRQHVIDFKEVNTKIDKSRDTVQDMKTDVYGIKIILENTDKRIGRLDEKAAYNTRLLREIQTSIARLNRSTEYSE